MEGWKAQRQGGCTEEPASIDPVNVVDIWVHRVTVSSRFKISKQSVVHAACSTASTFGSRRASPIDISFNASTGSLRKWSLEFASEVLSVANSRASGLRATAANKTLIAAVTPALQAIKDEMGALEFAFMLENQAAY